MACPGEVTVVHFILRLGPHKVQLFLLLSFFPYKSIIFGAFALSLQLASHTLAGLACRFTTVSAANLHWWELDG